MTTYPEILSLINVNERSTWNMRRIKVETKHNLIKDLLLLSFIFCKLFSL